LVYRGSRAPVGVDARLLKVDRDYIIE